jgi:hypothetical protein
LLLLMLMLLTGAGGSAVALSAQHGESLMQTLHFSRKCFICLLKFFVFSR